MKTITHHLLCLSKPLGLFHITITLIAGGVLVPAAGAETLATRISAFDALLSSAPLDQEIGYAGGMRRSVLFVPRGIQTGDSGQWFERRPSTRARVPASIGADQSGVSPVLPARQMTASQRWEFEQRAYPLGYIRRQRSARAGTNPGGWHDG